MINDIFNDYSPINESFPRDEFKNDFLKLPEKKKFERNFQVVADIVKARIRTNYEVYPGIRLTVSENREVIDFSNYREEQIAKLAEEFERYVDIDELEKIIKNGL